MAAPLFRVTDSIRPAGDQPDAIADVVSRFSRGEKTVVLAGATGTGKSATTAWVIEALGKPTLVLAPNKVLAAQLAAELRDLLPSAFVGFFVSHFSYYRPEAYLPSSDTFIEKDSAVDVEIERLRHEATVGLLTRPDAIVVASVSAIYGLGRPDEYRSRGLQLEHGVFPGGRDGLLKTLVDMGYSRNDAVLEPGRFRVRGDTVDIHPVSSASTLRAEFWGDEIERVTVRDDMAGSLSEQEGPSWIFPTSHHVVAPTSMAAAMSAIRQEMEEKVAFFERSNLLVEAQRLRMRTEADLEMLETTGHCRGIENYSRHFDGRNAGDPPACLLDYFPEDFLLVVDESHVTVPQLGAMYEGDRSRKQTLVDHGFRLPSALDNRPLRSAEFWPRIGQTLALSATPGLWEDEHSSGGFVDQVIRPTGVVDPSVDMCPREGQMEEFLSRARRHVSAGRRVLVTTLTKRQAEDVTEFLVAQGLRARYLHSDVDTVERISLLRSLRAGRVDVLVGVNLLREGLDLPEVGLVAIFDADSEGFLRSRSALLQTIGRAARNPDGEVVLFADKHTEAMRQALGETNRRRRKQLRYNTENGIVPASPSRAPADVLAYQEVPGASHRPSNRVSVSKASAANASSGGTGAAGGSLAGLIGEIKEDLMSAKARMSEAAKALAFEDAALWRDEAALLEAQLAELSNVHGAV